MFDTSCMSLKSYITSQRRRKSSHGQRQNMSPCTGEQSYKNYKTDYKINSNTCHKINVDKIYTKEIMKYVSNHMFERCQKVYQLRITTFWKKEITVEMIKTFQKVHTYQKIHLVNIENKCKSVVNFKDMF